MKPLVLVHGFLGGSRQWEDQEAALGASFEVVTVDLPGFGDNSDVDAPDSIAGFAKFVLDHLTDAGIDSFHLLGHSMGGMIVQEMAARAPDRIDRLILYGTSASGLMPDRFESIDVSKRRAEIDGPQATARRIAATWFLEGEHASAYEDCAAIAQCGSLQAIQAGLTAIAAWSLDEQLPQITAPTLVIWGDQDRSYAWSQIEQLWRDIPNARLSVVPGCAHAVHLEKPEIFNLIIQGFLEDNSH